MTEPGMIDEDRLFEEASAWHFRLSADDAGARDRQAFSVWLAQGTAQQRAWDEVQRLLGALREPARQVRRKESRRFRQAGGWASAAVLLLAVGLFALQPAWIERLRADHVTQVGESRTLALEDGSRLELNTDSAIQLGFEQDARRVRLLRGEAWFEVAHDTRRPFIVEVDDAWVRVLGTRFSVARVPGGMQVRVEQGQVLAGDEKGGVNLLAGDAVRYREGHLEAVQRFDPQVAFAWRQGQLVFRQQPLVEVAAELDRYWPGYLLILDEELRDQAVSGVFEIGRPGAVLNALERTLGLHVSHYGPLKIISRQ